MYQNNNNNQWDFIDILSILSFIVAIQNLKENEEQSAHNDVQKANDKQANTMMKELKKMFQEQNEMLVKILERVKNAPH